MNEFLGKDLKDHLWTQVQFQNHNQNSSLKLFECLLLDTYEGNQELTIYSHGILCG